MSKWNRPMTKYKPANLPAPEHRSAIHPKTRSKLLSALKAKPLTMPELADATGLQLNSTYRLLPVLERNGDVQRVPSNPYQWERI